MPLEPLLTVDDLTAYLGVIRRFVYQLTHERRIAFQRFGGSLQFSEAAVAAYLASEETPAASTATAALSSRTVHRSVRPRRTARARPARVQGIDDEVRLPPTGCSAATVGSSLSSAGRRLSSRGLPRRAEREIIGGGAQAGSKAVRWEGFMASTARSWLDDEPITRAEDDLLGRGPFAAQVAGVLDRAGQRPASTVVALTGPWGSGKSSTIELILNELDRATNWRVEHVNPWGLGGAEAIIGEVLTAIRSALPGKTAAKARRAMASYSAAAAPALGLIPLAGPAAKDVLVASATLAAGDTTLASQSKAVRKKLEALGQPILIVVDDIDRLQPADLLALFKAVRVLGRLPHVHYLLAYDQQTVIDLISSTPVASDRRDRAAEFMEKLVNVRVDQPPVRPDQAAGLYDAHQRRLLTELGIELSTSQQQRLATEHVALHAAALHQPRAIGRFFAQLYTYLPLVGPDEIDLCDFIGLTLLRVATPNLFEQLSAERHVLTGTEGFSIDRPYGRWGGDHRALINEALGLDANASHTSLTAAVAESLDTMFPALSSSALGAEHPDDALARRAADDDYIDQYFLMSRPASNLPDVTIKDALRLWADREPAGAASMQMRDILQARAGTPLSLRTAESVVRRAIVLTRELPSERSSGLLLTLAEELPGFAVPLRRLVADWVTTIVSRCELVDIDTILATVHRPPSENSGLFAILSGFDSAARATARLPASAQRQSWLADSARTLADAGLARFAAQVRLGDDAPLEAAFGYILYAERLLGRELVAERLVAMVEDGVPILDLAARFVSTGTYTDDYRAFVTEFNADDVAGRIGWDRIDAAAAELATTEDPPLVAHLSDYDPSWRNLKRHAAFGLLSHLESARDAQLAKLAQVDDKTRNALRNRATSVLAESQPDLEITATLWALETDIEISAPDVRSDYAQHWLELLNGSALAIALRAVDSFPGSSSDRFIISDSDGRTHERAAMSLTQPEPDGASQPGPPAIQVAVDAATETSAASNSGYARVLTVATGWWLRSLDERREPQLERATASTPWASALTLAEFWRWAELTVSSVFVPDHRLIGIADECEVVLSLTGNAMSGLDSVLDLRSVHRVTIRSAGSDDVMVSTPIRDREGAQVREPVVDPARVVGQLMRQWLTTCGFRDFEHAMAATSGRFRSKPPPV